MALNLLYLAKLFISAAVAGGLISVFGFAPQQLFESGIYSFGRAVTYEIANTPLAEKPR